MPLDEPDRFDAFAADLNSGDDLAAVIRAIIYVEHELIEFSRNRLADPEALKPMDLDYAGRVDLAVALGLPDELKSPLRAMGTLRNKFAHRLETRLTDEVVKQLYRTFTPTLKKATETSIRNTRAAKPEWSTSEHHVDLPPRARFSIYIVSLWAAVYLCRTTLLRGTKALNVLRLPNWVDPRQVP